MELQDVDTGKVKGFYESKARKLPEVPDLTNKGAVPRRGDPFILTDFRGFDAYQNPS